MLWKERFNLYMTTEIDQENLRAPSGGQHRDKVIIITEAEPVYIDGTIFKYNLSYKV